VFVRYTFSEEKAKMPVVFWGGADMENVDIVGVVGQPIYSHAVDSNKIADEILSYAAPHTKAQSWGVPLDLLKDLQYLSKETALVICGMQVAMKSLRWKLQSRPPSTAA
jgi:hypothetical protein